MIKKTPKTELQVSWDTYNRMCERLALRIRKSGRVFDSAICLSRGGLHVGNLVSRMLGLQLGVLDVTLYGDKKSPEGADVFVADAVTFARGHYIKGKEGPAFLGHQILVLDDLCDTGETMGAVLEELPNLLYDGEVCVFASAVLWASPASAVQPTFHVEELPPNTWIVQPFERYNLNSLQELSSAQERG